MCEEYLNNHFSQMSEAIRETMVDEHEHAFGFSQDKNGPVILGNCDDVDKPNIPGQIGTFHTHTIYNSRPSQDDYDVFLKSTDKLMCYGRPMEGFWQIRCYDREFNICAEKELTG